MKSWTFAKKYKNKENLGLTSSSDHLPLCLSGQTIHPPSRSSDKAISPLLSQASHVTYFYTFFTLLTFP